MKWSKKQSHYKEKLKRHESSEEIRSLDEKKRKDDGRHGFVGLVQGFLYIMNFTVQFVLIIFTQSIL